MRLTRSYLAVASSATAGDIPGQIKNYETRKNPATSHDRGRSENLQEGREGK